MSEMRWNPLLEEWVVTATHRQDRTFLPPKDYCPLCPTRKGSFPTEVPAEDYEYVVFDNKFPTFRLPAPEPTLEGDDLYRVAPSEGVCEVVLYSPHHEGSLTDCSVLDIYRLVQVWTDRFLVLGKLPQVKYVYIFENKGEAIGVTLPHPHGQIYAFPFIPPKIAREVEASRKHFRAYRRCLLCTIIERELSDEVRVVCRNEGFAAVVPFYARYPYEVHILSLRHLGSLAEMDDREHRLLAEILKEVLVRYDRLWSMSMPYMMVMHQSPCTTRSTPFYHFHIEFYPPRRTAAKLKYLAGCESGAGTFINDTLPEEKAQELRALPFEKEILSWNEE